MTDENFEINGFSKREITIDIVRANGIAILLALPIILILAVPFFIIQGSGFTNPLKDLSPLPLLFMIFFSLAIGIIAHELIHGITWSLFLKKGFRSIKFGVMWKMLTPYCHSKEPLRLWQYIIGALMPCVFLGILPAVAAWVNGNLFELLFGLLFTLTAGGDLAIVWMLRKEKMDQYVMDHPSKVGCFIYDSEEN